MSKLSISVVLYPPSHSRVSPMASPLPGFLAAPHGSYRVLPDPGPGFFLLVCRSFLALGCAVEVRPCAALSEALCYCEYALPPSKTPCLVNHAVQTTCASLVVRLPFTSRDGKDLINRMSMSALTL